MEKKIDFLVVGDIETNCWFYLLEAGRSGAGSLPCALIDPGDEAGRIVARLRELNWVPRYIFLTHGHLDHLAALPALLEAFGKGAFGGEPLPEIGIHRFDSPYLGKSSLSVHRESFIAAGGSGAYVDALWKPMPPGDLFFEEGSAAGPFRVLHLPGHTPGGVGFYDEDAHVLFSGDTLFRGDRGRTDLPGGDEEAIARSLKRLFSLPEDTAVCPGHGPVTTIGEEAEVFGGS